MEDIQSVLGIFSVVAGILGSILTGVISYLVARSNIHNDMKKTQVEVKKIESDPQYTGITTAEKLGNLSLEIAENLHQQLKNCSETKDGIEKEIALLKIDNARIKLLVQNTFYRIKGMMNKYLLVQQCDNGEDHLVSCLEVIGDLDEIIQNIEID